MKIKNIGLISALIAAVVLAGCGKNEKKQALILGMATSGGAGGAGQPASAATTAAIAKNSANMAARAGAAGTMTGMPSPRRAVSSLEDLASLGTPDSEGFYTYPGFTGTTMKVKFMDSSGTTLTIGPAMANLDKINALVTSTYEFGTFNGDFLMKFGGINATTETMEKGEIKASDPVGGSFTATMNNVVVKRFTTADGLKMGLPMSGSMSIVGSSGYTGTNTYSTDGTIYKCEGPIYLNGTKVAEVYLSFDSSFGNYTGYYIDSSDNSKHTIE